MEEQEINDFDETEGEEDFEALLNQSMGQPVHFAPGERVETTVTQVTKDWVFIDVGGKSDGCIVRSEFVDADGKEAVQEGDKIRAYFLSSKNNDMLFTTRLTGDTTGGDAHLEEAYHGGIPVEGVVEKEIKGGFSVRIAGSVHAFCPYSQMGFHRIDNASQYVGKPFTFKIIEYAKRGRNIVVSHRAILEEERQKQRDVLKASLQEGMVVHGTITAIQKFGAFVDIGGIEGLIPISEISWGRVEDIHSALSVGQGIDVAVKKLDWEKNKFSFSLKDTKADPWHGIAQKYPEGTIHQGRVARLVPFGAFITLAPGIDGLVHISELGKGKRIRHPREVLEENQTIEVKVSRVDEASRRLSLVLASEARAGESLDDYKQQQSEADQESPGGFGNLGDVLRAKMKGKKE